MHSLLLVGTGDSIFLYNYVKAFKKKRDDVLVSVYSPHPNKHLYNDLPYDEICFNNFSQSILGRIPILSFILTPIIQRIHFHFFLRKRFFDIIHVHRVLPAWLILPRSIKKHCRGLYVSFWGGEIENEVLFCSHKLYLNRLNTFLQVSDRIVNSNNNSRFFDLFPFIQEKYSCGVFGSSIIDIICQNSIRIDSAKGYFNIPLDKVSILIGYSGKAIHQHEKVLTTMMNNPCFVEISNRIHLLATMTRGASADYIDAVEAVLKDTGCSFTLLRNGYQSDKDVALFRKATDILLQFSEFDGLSASVKEALCAGSIVISGDWLNYDSLKKDGFYFESVPDISKGIIKLFDIVCHYDSYRSRAQQNIALCGQRFSWDSCIANWISAYELFLPKNRA